MRVLIGGIENGKLYNTKKKSQSCEWKAKQLRGGKIGATSNMSNRTRVCLRV